MSSQWGTFGETGRKVFIGGPDGFFGITALSDSGPLTLAGLEQAVHSAGVPSRPVNDAFIAGLQADQLNVTAGPKRFTIAFGGQHLRFSPHERATLWPLRSLDVAKLSWTSGRRIPASSGSRPSWRCGASGSATWAEARRRWNQAGG